MHGPAAIRHPGDCLDIFGQQPGLNLYTQICSCYPIFDDSSHSQIINTLTNGLERLSKGFPWVAGQIINEGSSEGNTGTFKIKALENIPRLTVKDLRNDPSIPNMNTLRKASFPMSMLDENIIAPRNTVPGSSGESKSDITPVFLVQVNFITGGLLLTFVGHHQAMDMTGQGRIIQLLSKACRNEPFKQEEISAGNLRRRKIIPLLDDSYPGSEIDSEIVKPSQPAPSSSTPPDCLWASFTFSSTSLIALKTLATSTLTLGYVSTDDTLSAFIWRLILRARLPRLDPTMQVTMSRAIDVRRYLNISPNYPGMIQKLVYHTSTLHHLLNEPLGVTASKFRAAIDPKTTNIAHETRALATLMSCAADKNSIPFVATLDVSSDVMLSSWVKIDSYDLDFGFGVGKPEAVRRPRFIPYEGLVYLLPKNTEGGIGVAMCLRNEDMERLRADEEWVKHATYIG